MTPSSQRIFDLLEHRKHWTLQDDLAHELGYTDGRALRRHEDKEGIIDIAAREIWRETGLVLLRRMNDPAGLKLSNDPDEISRTIAQWKAWIRPIEEIIRQYEAAYNMITNPHTQLELLTEDAK